MFEKFLLHPLLNGMLRDYLMNLKCVKWNHDILLNMKARIIEHLTSPRKFNLIIVKKIVCMLASGLSNCSSRGVARILGVDKPNIRNVLERRIQLDTMKDFFGLHGGELMFICSTWILERYSNIILDKPNQNFT